MRCASSWSVSFAVALAATVAAPATLLAADVGEIALVEDTAGDINGSIALPNVYLGKVACAFYKTHSDQYDAIFVFTSIPQNFLTNVQQGWPVQIKTKGIGRDLGWDQTKAFCSSTGKLRQAVKMGDIAILPDNTDALYTGIPFYPLTGIELVAHEFGHHWLASVTFDKGDGKTHCLLRGFEPKSRPRTGTCDGYEENDFNQHWSYYFNSGSLMYGSMIVDLGGGKFQLSYSKPKYSPLDQYLMGLRAKHEVPAMFVVDVGDLAGAGSASIPIGAGKTASATGTRLSFTIDDVIRAEGARVPAKEYCHWTAAFIIVHAAGQPPSSTVVAKVDKYRTRWESFYAWATDNRGSFDTTLAGTGAATCTGFKPPDGGVRDARPRDAARRDGRARDATVDRGSLDAALPVGADEGCGCRVAEGRDELPLGRFAVAALFGLALLRRRRRSGAR